MRRAFTWLLLGLRTSSATANLVIEGNQNHCACRRAISAIRARRQEVGAGVNDLEGEGGGCSNRRRVQRHTGNTVQGIAVALQRRSHTNVLANGRSADNRCRGALHQEHVIFTFNGVSVARRAGSTEIAGEVAGPHHTAYSGAVVLAASKDTENELGAGVTGNLLSDVTGVGTRRKLDHIASEVGIGIT